MTKQIQKNKTVLITGCSEGGIGFALAREFHRRGLRVFATARDLNKVQPLQEEGIETVQLDVTNPDSIQAAVETVTQLTGDGTLDILVNNAGAGYSTPLADADLAEARRLFDVNVWGVLAITQAFVPLLARSSSSPRVVNVGSVVARMHVPWQGIYNASKASLASLNDTMRLELSILGITVLHVYTGGIKTEFLAHSSGRTLPKDSMYQPVASAIEANVAGEASTRSQTMTAEAYARSVVANALSRRPGSNTWVGGSAFVSRVACRFGWDGVVDFVLRVMFDMTSLRSKWEAASRQGVKKEVVAMEP